MIKQIFLVFTLFFLMSCGNNENIHISKIFDDKFSKKLDLLGVDEFIFTRRSDFQLNIKKRISCGGCDPVTYIMTTEKETESLAQTMGLKKNGKWKVYLPTSATKIEMDNAINVLSEGIYQMISILENEKKIRETWSK